MFLFSLASARTRRESLLHVVSLLVARDRTLVGFCPIWCRGVLSGTAYPVSLFNTCAGVFEAVEVPPESLGSIRSPRLRCFLEKFECFSTVICEASPSGARSYPPKCLPSSTLLTCPRHSTVLFIHGLIFPVDLMLERVAEKPRSVTLSFDCCAGPVDRKSVV